LANSLSHAIIDTCSPASITFFPCLISLLLQRPKNTFSAKQFLPQKKSVVIIIRDVTTFVTHGKRESRANKKEKKKRSFLAQENQTHLLCARRKANERKGLMVFFFLLETRHPEDETSSESEGDIERKTEGLCYCKWLLNGSKALLMRGCCCFFFPSSRPHFVRKKGEEENIKTREERLPLYCFRINII
jgi:hypothetical protein